MPVTVSFNDAEFRRMIVRKQAAMRKAVNRAAVNSIAIYEGDIIERYDKGTSGIGLKSRGGTLRGGMRQGFKVDKDLNVELTVHNDVEYARIHEKGGIVRPKKQYLTIPTKHITGGAGQRTRRIKDFPDDKNHFFIRRGARLFFARKAGRGVDILFVLVRSVRIPKRPIWRFVFLRRKKDVLREWDKVGEAVANG